MPIRRRTVLRLAASLAAAPVLARAQNQPAAQPGAAQTAAWETPRGLGSADAKTEVQDDPQLGVYQGAEQLRWYIEVGRGQEKQSRGSTALWKDETELEAFKQRFRKRPWQPKRFAPGTTVRAFAGIDGGSGVNTTGGNISVTATDNLMVTSEALAVSVTASLSGGSTAAAISIALSLALDSIDNDVAAYITNAGSASAPRPGTPSTRCSAKGS